MERNTILQGDCLDLMRDVPSGSVDMILADLPYGTTNCAWDSVIPFAPLWEQYERIIKPNGAIVLTASQPFTTALISSRMAFFKYVMTWHKRRVSGFLNAKKQPLRSTEDIVVFYKRQPTYNPQFGERKHKRDFTNMTMKPHSENFGTQKEYKSTIDKNSPAYPTTLIDIRGLVNNEKEKVAHPTQKPVALFEYLIRTYTNPGELVMDNTAGSGTTAVACINTGRDYLLMEREPAYVETCRRRVAEARAALPLFAQLVTA